MTPFRLLEYGAAAAADVLLIGLAALAVFAVLCYLRAPSRPRMD